MLSCGKDNWPWGTYAMPLATRWWVLVLVMSSPPKVMVPLRAGSRPSSVFSSVVLPAPLWPITAKTEWSGTVNEMPCTTSIGP